MVRSFFRPWIWILTALLSMAPPAIYADEAPPFSTDRPSQSDASSLVPQGYFQIEAGYTSAHDDAIGTSTDSQSAPNLSLRYGLLKNLEVRFGWNGFIHNNPDPGPVQDGSGDGQVSAKWHLWKESDRIPEVTLLAGTTLPLGENGISSERSDPFFRFLMTQSLPGRFSFSSNLGVTWNTSASGIASKDTAADFIYTALLNYAVSPELDSFVEFFGSIALEEKDDRHGFDAGIAWRIFPTVQVDLSGGLGLNDAAVDAFVSAGLSFRLP